MASPGLFLSRISSAEPVTGDRVDEHLSVLFNHVNGGLTYKNLSPSVRVPTTMMAEPNSVFTMVGKIRNTLNDGGGNSVCLGQTAFACRLIGVSYAMAAVSANFNPASAIAIVFFGDGSTTANRLILGSNLEIPAPATQIMPIDGANNLMISGYIPWETTFTVPAGTIIHCQSSIVPGAVIGNVACWFAITHST